MNNVVAAGCFAIFVVAGLLTRGGASEEARKKRVRWFVVIACLISLGAGATQRDWWPFSAWPLIAGELKKSVIHPRLVAVDENGAEVAIDFRALQPFEFDELMSWLNARFEKLDEGSRQQAMQYMLSLVHQGQGRMREGKSAGYFNRYLGPVTAPYFLLHPALWTSAQYPQQTLTRLRFYREEWTLGDHVRTLHRVLVYEYQGGTRP